MGQKSQQGVAWFSAWDLAMLKPKCQRGCFLYKSHQGRRHFRAHSGRWQNLVPWDYELRPQFPRWLSAEGHSQLPEADLIPRHVAPSSVKQAMVMSCVKSLTALSVNFKLKFRRSGPFFLQVSQAIWCNLIMGVTVLPYS